MPIIGSFGGIAARGFGEQSGSLIVTISPSTTSVNEGSSVTLTVTTQNFGTGTLYWTILGLSGTVNDADFSSPASAVSAGGSVAITNNLGSFSLTLANDLTTEGPETFNVSIRTVSTSGTIKATSATITINDTSITPNFVIPPNLVIPNFVIPPNFIIPNFIIPPNFVAPNFVIPPNFVGTTCCTGAACTNGNLCSGACLCNG